MKEEQLKESFICNTAANEECSKTGCYINGGACLKTLDKKYAAEGTLALAEKLKWENLEALNDMFTQQYAFQARVDSRVSSTDPSERASYIKEHSLYLEAELQEMLYEIPYFKRWKDYSNMTEQERNKAYHKARKELIDVWHFFMNLALALDFTPETFYFEYLLKIAENNQRQEEGYTHDKSYR